LTETLSGNPAGKFSRRAADPANGSLRHQ